MNWLWHNRWNWGLVGLVTVDLLSKSLAEQAGVVSLNSGISFSWFSGWERNVVVSITVVALVCIWWWWRRWYPTDELSRMFFLAGGFANLLDRILEGAVRDWIPVPMVGVHNNLADWYIAVGVALFAWARWKEYRVK